MEAMWEMGNRLREWVKYLNFLLKWGSFAVHSWADGKHTWKKPITAASNTDRHTRTFLLSNQCLPSTLILVVTQIISAESTSDFFNSFLFLDLRTYYKCSLPSSFTLLLLSFQLSFERKPQCSSLHSSVNWPQSAPGFPLEYIWILSKVQFSLITLVT